MVVLLLVKEVDMVEQRDYGNEIGHNLGRGGALVETMTFNRRVVGSTPALAAT